MSVRVANVADAEQILALQKLAYESEARLYDDWAIPPMTETLDALAASIRNDTVLMSWDGSVITGSVRATFCDAICRIGRLMVHPDYQGRGIGTALLQAIEAHFPGAASFELFTGSRSEGNIRLYRRAGYVVTGARRVSDQVTLVDMSKRVHRVPS